MTKVVSVPVCPRSCGNAEVIFERVASTFIFLSCVVWEVCCLCACAANVLHSRQLLLPLTLSTHLSWLYNRIYSPEKIDVWHGYMGVMMAPDHRFFQTHTKVLYIANKIIVDPVNIPTSCSCIFLFEFYQKEMTILCSHKRYHNTGLNIFSEQCRDRIRIG